MTQCFPVVSKVLSSASCRSFCGVGALLLKEILKVLGL